MYKFVVKFVLFFLISTTFQAQEMAPFKKRFSITVKGDMTFIANNILNRIDRESSPNIPYDNRSFESLINDEIEMEYINIKPEKGIFSSSSAALFMNDEKSKRIVYAGLYWTGTYLFESGYKKKNKIVAYDNSRYPVDHVMLGLPKSKTFTTVKGEVIFDNPKKRGVQKHGSYAVYADITSLVQELENPFGFYTVANIRATQGNIENGSAAGWVIVFIYEDASLPEKQMVTYDGFASMQKNYLDIGVDLPFQLSDQPTHTKLLVGALEGDLRGEGDMLYYFSDNNLTMKNFNSKLRHNNNIFNSSITQEDREYVYRIPASKNTLGFDVFQKTLVNTDSIYNQKTKKLYLTPKTNGDEFSMFLHGWTFTPKDNTLKFGEQPYAFGNVKNEMVAKLRNEYFNGEDILPYEMREVKEEQIDNETYTEMLTQVEEKSVEKINRKYLHYDKLEKGYYLVANVFSEAVNLRQFLSNMHKMGIKSDYFINPYNKFYYVYLYKSTDLSKVEQQWKSQINGKYTQQLWILDVNIE